MLFAIRLQSSAYRLNVIASVIGITSWHVPPHRAKVMRAATEQPTRLSVGHLLRCGMVNVGGGSRMKRYRRYAADCLKMAQSAAKDSDKALLLQMAETWGHLAELAEAKATVRKDEDT
jgi:hypothetical protein